MAVQRSGWWAAAGIELEAVGRLEHCHHGGRAPRLPGARPAAYGSLGLAGGWGRSQGSPAGAGSRLRVDDDGPLRAPGRRQPVAGCADRRGHLRCLERRSKTTPTKIAAEVPGSGSGVDGAAYRNRTDDLRITSVFSCVARGSKPCASFRSTGCCWWRSLAVDDGPGTSRGHAPVVRGPGSQRCGATGRSPVSGRGVPAHGAPEPSRSARKDDLIEMQRDPGIRRKCLPTAQPWTLGRSDIEPIADQYAGLRIHVMKMLQRHRHFGKLRDPEELVVRGQLRYLADVLAELRRQPGRGFPSATGLPEHVVKNNTRFSAHGLLDFGGPVPARGPASVPGLVLHQRMVRPKDLGICSKDRHRASPAFLSEVTGAARLQPAPAAMSSLSRAWRTSRRCSPALLSGLAGNAKTDADLSPGVTAAAQALDRFGYGGIEFVREAGHEGESFDIAFCDAAAVGAQDAADE